MNHNLGIIGLGYVGLPLAIAFSRKFPYVVGFDINTAKVDELLKGIDRTGEILTSDLASSKLRITSNINDLSGVDFFVIAVPTPINEAKRPDLTAMIKASETVAKVMRSGAIVVYESTVYPGVIEEICGPILEKISGLKQGKDFKLGYSPERVSPGDKQYRLENIVKIVSGEDDATLQAIAEIYSAVIEAGIYCAPSIKVAEAAKVIENTQRDLNIALMNELAIIFNKMNIKTADVLEAAATKWNFLRFSPGLVGGHCIGVDPYYLTYKAEEIGYNPQVILAGRRINDSMGKYVAEQTVKHLAGGGKPLSESKVGILGLTFKENVPDLRNSRVPDILAELKEYGIKALVHDPLADAGEAMEEYGIELTDMSAFQQLDALVLAVAHNKYIEPGTKELVAKLKYRHGVIIDVKSVLNPKEIPHHVKYWSL